MSQTGLENNILELVEEKESTKYLYCLVRPNKANGNFYYLSEFSDVAVNDLVVIPFGAYNTEVIGTVLSAKYYTKEEAPFPVERTKTIIRKADKENNKDTGKNIAEENEEDSEEYLYCNVKPTGQSYGYYYISEIESIKFGDMVIVPFGSENREMFGTVSFVRRFRKKDAPYPPERTKRIIRKASSDNTIYEFISVLPITHKQKIFGYINKLTGIEVGDYVEVEFREDTRIAQVKSKKTGTLEHVPDNFMGTMKVLRKLNYDNCDFIRFNADLLPLAMKEGLYRERIDPSDIHIKRRLTECAVKTFESVYRIQLPEEYRHFIQEISNGYGDILGLSATEYLERYTWLKYPFLFDELLNRFINSEGDTISLECECDSADCSTCDHQNCCPYSEVIEGKNKENPFFDGTLKVYCYGDIEDYLIVNGNYVGTVLRHDDEFGDWCIIARSFREYVKKIHKMPDHYWS